MAKKNVLTHAKKLKAQEHLNENRLEAARDLLLQICQLDPRDAEAWSYLALSQRRLGQLADAEAAARRAIQIQPKYARARQMLGTVLQCAGEIAGAIESYHEALQLEPHDAETHYLLGNALKDRGSTAEAIVHYEKAIALRPDFLAALSNAGAALTATGRPAEALGYLERARVLSPNAPQVLCNIATILELDGQFDAAREKLWHALQFAPDFIDALAAIASLDEKAGRLEEAKQWVAKGLALAPENHSFIMTAAKLARGEQRFEEAIALLEKLRSSELGTASVGDIYINLGKLYDRVGNAARAYECFCEGNRLLAETLQTNGFDRLKYMRRIDRVRTYLTDELKCAQTYPNAGPDRTPVFLLGFPRSGTTLLDQILDSHPQLQTLSEKPTMHALTEAFQEMADGNPGALAALTEGEICHLRKVYFDAVRQQIKLQQNTILVDKMPLSTVWAHLIWRIFPDAKFILAIRHPCDVCLSCFMQNFAINEAMVTFNTMEDTVALYARVMSMWQDYVSALPLNYHRVRYEDLVANFENEARALLEFLGVEWHERVKNFNEHAKNRAINTPSYHQVTQPIYQHARFRWTRYAAQLAPVMGTLAPFIEYFGYDRMAGSAFNPATSADTEK